MGAQERGSGTTVRDADGRSPKHIDAREAASVLGVSRRAIRNLVARGELAAERDGESAAARTLVSVASVDRLLSERRGRGGPDGGAGD